MFLGEYEHTLDEKNRLVIPAKFRTFIRSEQDREGFFILYDPATVDKCLRLYTPSGWQRQAEAIRTDAEKSDNPTDYYRLYAAHAEFIPADTQFRVVLPQKRLEEVGLSREVLLVGNFEWIEVWDPSEYRDQKARLKQKYSAELKQKPLWPKAPAKE